MNNGEIARIFEMIAVFLELGDENPFRIRAYRQAALHLESLAEDVAEIAKRGKLEEIPGIGADLAGKIAEYLKTGQIRFYEELKRKVPAFLVEMLEIPGVGPKTAKLVYDRFKPRNLDELEAAARSEKFQKLPGIREKTAHNILEGIAFLRKHRGRTLISVALSLAEEICGKLKSLKEVRELSVAGSVRRLCETVHDIDILVSSGEPERVMDAFVKLDGVERVLAKGQTKSSVVLKPGIQVDLRVVEPEVFGAALVYFTGSKAHNIKLRTLAKKRGYKISEYGLFNAKTGRRLAARREEDLYAALGLAWVPPELREDQGEIEAAASGRLPALIEAKDIRGDLHMHSDWTDGQDTMDAMFESSKRMGYQYVVLTDHSKSLKIAHGLSPAELKKQIRTVRELNKKMKGLTVLCGSEVDILEDGSIDFDDQTLSELDFVVASVHSRFKQDKATMTQRIIKAMQNPYVHAIGHLTGRLIGERDSYDVDFDAIFKEAVRTHTAIEINAQPRRLDLDSVHARRARELGVRFVVNSDSHATDQLKNLRYGVAIARRAWCGKEDVLNSLSLNDFKKSLKKKGRILKPEKLAGKARGR